MILMIALIVAFCAMALIGLLRLIRVLVEDFFQPPVIPGDAQPPPDRLDADRARGEAIGVTER